MKRWLTHPFAQPLVLVIMFGAVVTTPFLFLWHVVRSKKVAVRDESLLVGKSAVAAKDIEYLRISAYYPFATLSLKCVGRRAQCVSPTQMSVFYAWIKKRNVALRIEGERKEEFERFWAKIP
jgi:hypothetical protein